MMPLQTWLANAAGIYGVIAVLSYAVVCVLILPEGAGWAGVLGFLALAVGLLAARGSLAVLASGLVLFLAFLLGEHQSTQEVQPIRLGDALLALAWTVYFASVWRSLAHHAQLAPGGKAVDESTPLAPAEFEDSQATWMLVRAALSVGVAAVLVRVMQSLIVVPNRLPPFEWRPEGMANPAGGQFALLCGVLATVGVALGFVSWYWALQQTTADEGRMILLDMAWREHRRELNRTARWRAWRYGTLRFERPELSQRTRWRNRVGLLLAIVLLPVALFFTVRMVEFLQMLRGKS